VWFRLIRRKKFQHLMGRTGYPLIGLNLWPLVVSFSLGGMAISGVNFMYGGCFTLFWFFFRLLIISVACWWSEVAFEGTFEGRHTMLVRKSYRLGYKMFLVSEFFFFASFFWAWFNCGTGELQVRNTLKGAPGWPPRGIPLFAWHLEPGFNLALLLRSGVRVTCAHKRIVVFNVCWYGTVEANESRLWAIIYLVITILLGLAFVVIQFEEYRVLPFNVNDSSYGSCFFMLTGFHGLHVILGLIMLCITLWRLFSYHFFKGTDAFFVKAVVWYWHFVDAIWILVLRFVYAWPNYLYKFREFIQFFL